jgi:hypothetical protein
VNLPELVLHRPRQPHPASTQHNTSTSGVATTD